MSILLALHVLLSLVGIAAGLVEVAGWFTRRRANHWRAVFLWSTLATSLTGYVLPATQILPSHIVGAVSVVALAFTIFALYRKQLVGGWRRIYVITAALALYLNLFVGVVQAFQRIPALHALAPTQSEAPFALAQGGLFVLFLIVAFVGVRRSGERLTPSSPFIAP